MARLATRPRISVHCDLQAVVAPPRPVDSEPSLNLRMRSAHCQKDFVEPFQFVGGSWPAMFSQALLKKEIPKAFGFLRRNRIASQSVHPRPPL
jgi:hypothetical protein